MRVYFLFSLKNHTIVDYIVGKLGYSIPYLKI